MARRKSLRLKKVGGYELIERIGQGATGAVFKARQISMERFVALKILSPKIAQNQPAFMKRFIREARVSARLEHPNLVRGIEVGQDPKNGLRFFAMELIEGPSLKTMLQEQGPLQEEIALKIAQGIARALSCAQKAGIVHRDVKPDNILLTKRGEPKLADLGLAKAIAENLSEGSDKEGATDLNNPSIDSGLTAYGKTLGTPYYMAPEQAKGETDKIDIRSDLYALGATLFHVLTGHPPFKGPSAAHTIKLHTSAPIPGIRTTAPKISRATDLLVRRLMQKDPSARFQNADEVVQAIEEILDAQGHSTDSSVSQRTSMQTKTNKLKHSARIFVESVRLHPTVTASPRLFMAGLAAAAVAIAALLALLLHLTIRPANNDPIEQEQQIAAIPSRTLKKTDANPSRHKSKIATGPSTMPLKGPTKTESTPSPGPATPEAEQISDRTALTPKGPGPSKNKGTLPIQQPVPASNNASSRGSKKEKAEASSIKKPAPAKAPDVAKGTPSPASPDVKGVSRTDAKAQPTLTIRQAPPGPKKLWRMRIGGIVSLELILAPAGSFVRSKQKEGAELEALITLSQPFYIGKYEVTQSQYEEIMRKRPSKFAHPFRPVERVSWEEAQTFCEKLSQAMKFRVALPTEAQWEYACRSGSKNAKLPATSDANAVPSGWFLNNSKGQTQRVGQKAANAWGLFDMQGNVREWCRDSFGPLAGGKCTDPTGAPNGPKKVGKGGSFKSEAATSHPGQREALAAHLRSDDLGFRIVVPLDAAGKPIPLDK